MAKDKKATKVKKPKVPKTVHQATEHEVEQHTKDAGKPEVKDYSGLSDSAFKALEKEKQSKVKKTLKLFQKYAKARMQMEGKNVGQVAKGFEWLFKNKLVGECTFNLSGSNADAIVLHPESKQKHAEQRGSFSILYAAFGIKKDILKLKPGAFYEKAKTVK